jgi:hypothetical protein
MSTKSAAHLKKVESSMRILQTTTGVKVRQAMILAQFSKKDIVNDSICRMIHRRLEENPKSPQPTSLSPRGTTWHYTTINSTRTMDIAMRSDDRILMWDYSALHNNKLTRTQDIARIKDMRIQ